MNEISLASTGPRMVRKLFIHPTCTVAGVFGRFQPREGHPNGLQSQGRTPRQSPFPTVATDWFTHVTYTIPASGEYPARTRLIEKPRRCDSSLPREGIMNRKSLRMGNESFFRRVVRAIKNYGLVTLRDAIRFSSRPSVGLTPEARDGLRIAAGLLSTGPRLAITTFTSSALMVGCRVV
jgi:hypothetical protein